MYILSNSILNILQISLKCDAPVVYQGNFQDPVTLMFEGTIEIL